MTFFAVSVTLVVEFSSRLAFLGNFVQSQLVRNPNHATVWLFQQPREHVHTLGMWHHGRRDGSRRGVCVHKETCNLQRASVAAPQRQFSTVPDAENHLSEILRILCNHS